ncbi:MAG: hypothetical protein ACXVBV_19455 [Isosphaeraceae bacterium]
MHHHRVGRLNYRFLAEKQGHASCRRDHEPMGLAPVTIHRSQP